MEGESDEVVDSGGSGTGHGDQAKLADYACPSSDPPISLSEYGYQGGGNSSNNNNNGNGSGNGFFYIQSNGGYDIGINNEYSPGIIDDTVNINGSGFYTGSSSDDLAGF